MKALALLLFTGSVLTFIGFVVLASVGFARGVNYPFPPWFRNADDLFFYLAICFALLAVVLFFIARNHRKLVFISGSISAGTVMLIAFLTTRG
ncbi:MAG: hypothetical protein WB622_14160 [Acidobacteriaceae bacterium]